jgi:hypothetical protein
LKGTTMKNKYRICIKCKISRELNDYVKDKSDILCNYCIAENNKLRKNLQIATINIDGNIVKFDIEDWDLVHEYQWRVSSDSNNPYVYSSRHKTINRIHMSMHRLVMGKKEYDKCMIDHIDGDGLNNCKSNLRFCTASQNQANRKLSKNSKTGMKGVIYNKQTKLYVVHICKDRKHYMLGVFEDKIEAARAYDIKALELYGEFARTNKMLGLI